MRIGLYGGSFNPVHDGHLKVARQALSDLALDRLIILPAHVSPFKVDGSAHASAMPYDRLALVQAAFANLPRTTVDLREIARGGVSYAIDTVRAIVAETRQMNPGDHTFFFILGEDSVEGLPRWKEIEELRRLVTFKAYPRTKESSTEIRALLSANKIVRNPAPDAPRAPKAGTVCPCAAFLDRLRKGRFHGTCPCGLYAIDRQRKILI